MKVKILSLILLILSISLNAQNGISTGDYAPDERAIRANSLGMELINAAENGNWERVKYLVINTSVDINFNISNYPYSSLTALSCAIEIGNLEMVKFLVNNGANVNLDSKWHSYLVLAVKKGNLEIIKFLINNGADIDGIYDNTYVNNEYSSYSALMYSAYNGNLEMVKFLVNNGANINLLLNTHYYALNYAAKKGNLEIVKFLISKGANVNPNSGCPPLISSLEEEYPRYEHFEIVKFLVNNGANVNVLYEFQDSTSFRNRNRINRKYVDVFYQESTPLTLAVRGGNLQMVKFLVDNQADINMAGYGRQTPIYIAKERGWRDIISYLRTKGASE